jgi:hypothetical protein
VANQPSTQSDNVDSAKESAVGKGGEGSVEISCSLVLFGLKVAVAGGGFWIIILEASMSSRLGSIAGRGSVGTEETKGVEAVEWTLEGLNTSPTAGPGFSIGGVDPFH